MRNPLDHPAWIDISLLLGRVSLGLYFAIAGWNKISGEGGIAGFVSGPGYQGLKPAWLSDVVATPYGYALPVVEVICGLALMLGFFSRVAAGLIFLMLLSFTVAQATKLGIRGLDEKSTLPFNSNYMLIALAGILTVVGCGRLALDPLYSTPAGPPPKK